MCYEFSRPCAVRALPKPLATTMLPHAMSRPSWEGSKGQNWPSRREHPPFHALWGVLGSRSISKNSTRAPSIHNIKGGQGCRVKFSPCLSTPRGNTCHGVVHKQKHHLGKSSRKIFYLIFKTKSLTSTQASVSSQCNVFLRFCSAAHLTNK